jgi:hypothetical protein
MSPAQLAPTNRIVKPSRPAERPDGTLDAAEADRLIRMWFAYHDIPRDGSRRA